MNVQIPSRLFDQASIARQYLKKGVTKKYSDKLFYFESYAVDTPNSSVIIIDNNACQSLLCIHFAH